MTTIEAFRSSTRDDAPPPAHGPALQALWWLHKGDWNQAHDQVQQHEGDRDCDLVHAHLHRQEGDVGNAGYWYRRAGRTAAAGPVADEWTALATELLARE